jgi:hypothetical protein
MDNSIKAAIIAAVATVTAAIIGKGRWWAKKPESASERGVNITAQIGDTSHSFIAVGTQKQGNIHNYYGFDERADPFPGKVATIPRVVDIADAILAAKPYDRNVIHKNYVGLTVSWPVIFSSVNESAAGTWQATFDDPKAEYRSVSIEIDIDKYPKLKVIEYGHPAWIQGRILHADVRYVQLEADGEITLA